MWKALVTHECRCPGRFCESGQGGESPTGVLGLHQVDFGGRGRAGPGWAAGAGRVS